MNLFLSIKKKKIITRELAMIAWGIILSYIFSVISWKIGFMLMAYGFILIFIGAVCNFYVIYCNKCRIPVPARNKKELSHLKRLFPEREFCVIDENTKLEWLGDKIPLGESFYSFGDITAFMGILLFIINGIIIVSRFNIIKF